MSLAQVQWRTKARARSPWGHRVICGQITMARPCSRPSSIPKSRPRGSKASGLRYERAFAKALPGVAHGPWYEFIDDCGHGFCQPDFVWQLDKEIVVFETKLTDTPAGRAQTIDLYAPVLRAAHSLPISGIIVCKNLTKKTDLSSITTSLETALALSHKSIPILHWLGKGSL